MSDAPERLVSKPGPLGDALRAAAEHQPAGDATARVWRRLAEKPAPRRRPLLLAGAALAAGLAVALFWPRPPQPFRLLDGRLSAAALEPGARASVPANAFALLERGGTRVAVAPESVLLLDQGGLHLESGAFALTCSSPQRTAVGAMWVSSPPGSFVAEVSAERVLVYARSEELVVDRPDGQRSSVGKGTSWASSGAAPAESGVAAALGELVQEDATPKRAQLVARLLEAATPEPELDARARAEERAGHAAAAASLFSRVAASGGPRAATALYELATLRFRELGQPEGALEALDDYRRRFPRGALAPEAAMTAIEVRLSLSQDDAALAEMDAFLGHFTDSERADEVRWLRASLRVRRGACADATPDLRLLARAGERQDDASFALASCAGTRDSLSDYLRRFPSGKHRDAALEGLR